MLKKRSRTNFEISSNLPNQIKDVYEKNPMAMFSNHLFRASITMSRLEGISKENFEIAEGVDQSGIENVIDYSLEMLSQMNNHLPTLSRPSILINVLSSIQYIRLNAGNLKVLCIGPRTEAEFFHFIGEGFAGENLTGLDLMSYSEFVDVGDMHHMPYEDDTFDIVFVGWTLTYSKDLQRVADECLRVAKPGAYVAIGVESNGKITKGTQYGFTLTDAINIMETSEITDLFEGHIHNVPFRHEAHRSMRDSLDMVMVIIELK